MKIMNLTEGSGIYTANVYLVTGTWNTLSDKNTLIDVGRDRVIFDRINEASTGVGKQRVEQVILTHSHYDHAELLDEVKRTYVATTYAYSNSLKAVDHYLQDNQKILIGDEEFEVIHIPGHSTDSVCLYSESSGTLFAGDSPLIIQTCDGCYEEQFMKAFRRIANLDVQVIYFGHGKPLSTGCNKALRNSLRNISN